MSFGIVRLLISSIGVYLQRGHICASCCSESAARLPGTNLSLHKFISDALHQDKQFVYDKSGTIYTCNPF
jgi:hypothetical protein